MVLFISRNNSLYSKRTRIHPLTRINRCVEGEGQKYKPGLFMYNPSSSESIYDTKKRTTEFQWLVFCRGSIDSDNLFLFTDNNGEPKMCYRILIRYMGFPQDGFKLHKIDWL